MTSVRASLAFAVALLAGGLSTAGRLAASPAQLALTHQRLELPGVPVQTFAVDLDRDGRRDLAVVVAMTSWGEVGFEEPMAAGEDGTMVDVLTVIPAVLDRRELLVFFGGVGPGFAAEAVRFELPPTVHAIEAGPPAAPLVAWTDDGVAEIALTQERGLALVPRISEPTLLAGSASYLPRSGLLADLDGDGDSDLFVPVAGGLAVHLSGEDGLTPAPAALIAPPAVEPWPSASAPGSPAPPPVAEDRRARPESSAGFGGRTRGATLEVLLPQVIDLNGDHRPDLLYRGSQPGRDEVRVRLNLGAGQFGPAIDPFPGRSAAAPEATATPATKAASREVVWLGDLDGDGQAEAVTSEEITSDKSSMRAELQEAKRPRSRLRVHALGADGIWNPAPKAELAVEGYVFAGGGSGEGADGDEGGARFVLPSGVRDLDGDGRLDFVALKLDFSLFEAMRVLATKSIQLGLDFAIYRQGEGLSFRPVPGLDLAGEMRLRLDSLSFGQLSSFAGDFDGDGRAEFLQLGRGRRVTIHRGQVGATYAPAPDLAVTLEREPLDVALVAVSDFDGDGRSDLCVTQPVGGKEIGARAALDLYLSGGAR